jgi:PAS domain S-box-containing protein
MTNTQPISINTLPALRILIVDDNRTNLQILQVFLKKLGHTTISAENGEQAVRLNAAENPDLVLLDIMMPIMDGFEAARHIRAQPSDRWVPIIFLSALDRDENLVTGLEAGGDDFMSKPINFVVLEAKMRSMQRTLLLQRKTTEALKRIEAISDNVLDAIITIDSDAKIVACNSSCERIFGWPVAEMLGQNVSMLMPEPYRSEHDTYVQSYVQGGPPQIMGIGREALAVRKDGSIFAMEIGISEIRFDNQRLFIGIVRDISARKLIEQRLQEDARLLQRYHDETEAEGLLARELIDRQMLRHELDDAQLHYWLTPAENFSGDVVAACRSPDGRLYALLADATGHGLTAAISTLPVLTIFYGLAPTGAPLAEIIGAINLQLKQSMPVGRFVAATLLCLNNTTKTGEMWIGGTPGAVLLDDSGAEIRRFPSTQVPLGILETDSGLIATASFTWDKASQLVICSDGMTEAKSKDQIAFGLEGILSAIADVPSHLRLLSARNALSQHLGSQTAHDDVSIMLIDCPANS